MQTEISFKAFVFNDHRHKVILWISAALILLQFIVFKYFYPQAGFIHGDSFNYISSAYQNLGINTYMIGYAKFLRLFSVFTTYDNALVAFQYLFIEAAGLFLVFTLSYFYRPGKVVQWILLAFIVLNPLFLYMANYVSSDAFFLALSLVWFTWLLWIVHRPTWKLVVWHAIILAITFTVRYNALIYPLIAIIAFLLSSMPRRLKIKGIALSLGLVGIFVLYTGTKYKILTKSWQYAPFSGWQFANNAMYTYRYIDSADRKPVPARFKTLDNMIRQYFDTSRDVKKHPVEAMQASSVYMWDMRISPLYKYREFVFKKDSTAGELKQWASMAPLYKDYGTWIIRHYPMAFLQYFIWPNAKKYYAPPVEFLATYNSDKDSTANIGRIWFKYKTNKLAVRTKDRKVHMLDFYPILSGVTNVVILFILIFFLMLKASGTSAAFKKGVTLAAALWLINAGFTIFASSAALRFQAFPVVLSFIFMLVLVDWLVKVAFVPKPVVSAPATPQAIIEPHEEALSP